MFPTNTRQELIDCEQEAIHLCAAIQPHGVLMAVNTETGIVEFASSNLSDLLSLSPAEVLGKPAPALGEYLENFLYVKTFQAETLKVYEIEPRETREGNAHDDLPAVINAIGTTDDLDQLFQCIADAVQSLTTFDRVMIYRFESDWSGTVVAETVRNNFDSFLNSRFPAEDIPQQARDLYQRNSIRYIPNVDFKPVPVLSHTPEDEIDLSSSMLRSVSPIHIEYLHNMDVKASMSISIVVENKLWGLVACHHKTALVVTPEVRTICCSISNLCAQLIQTRVVAARHKREADHRANQLKLMDCLSKCNDVLTGIKQNSTETINLISASGIALVRGSEISTYGAAPEEKDVRTLISTLQNNDQARLFITDELTKFGVKLSSAGMNVASGVIAIQLEQDPPGWLIWFRPEIVSEVHWAGEPVKLSTRDQTRLHPRRSFKLWKEQVRGKSQPWVQEDIDVTFALSNYLRQRIAAEDRFGLALEASKQTVLLVDGHGEVALHNLAATILFHRTHSELIGKQLKALLPDGTNTKEISNEAGTVTPIEINTAPLTTPEGLFSLISITDVSQKRASEAERARLSVALQDSNQKMEQFVDTIAHDLRAPLLSIGNLAQWIEDDLGANLTGAAKDNMETLKKRTAKMHEQLKSLLEYSKAGSVRAVTEVVNIDEMVRSIAESIEKTKNYRMNFASLPTFKTVKAPIEHVFANLIENAAKYGGTFGGLITISAVDEGAYFRFSVEDEGQGIPIEYQSEVFYPLRTLAGADEQSHGMGLAFVKRIVEQNDGQIQLKSEPGKGSTFSFTWKKDWNPSGEIKTWKSSV